MEIVLAILLGGFFGFALAYVGATVFKNILKMLRLQDLTLAKVILFAIGFSSTLISLFGLIGLFEVSHFHVKTMNMGVILGGIMFGFAFGWIGTCPGTCVGAIFTKNIARAISAVLGGLLGAFSYSMTYSYFNKMGVFEKLDMGQLTLFNISDKYPSIFDLGFSGLLISGIIFMLIACIIPRKIRK